MIAGRRIWRTADGRHVFDDDPAAVVLAYGDGDDIPPEVVRELKLDTPAAKRAAARRAEPAPEAKMRKPSANKAREEVADQLDEGNPHLEERVDDDALREIVARQPADEAESERQRIEGL